MLIPFYFIIGIWGGPRARARDDEARDLHARGLAADARRRGRDGRARLAGTRHAADFVLSSLQHLPLARGSQEWIFLLFAAAFLVKMPAFPLHGWMPDGYREMPTEVLMVFSGVLSKVGAYGFLAIVLPLYPQASVHFQTLMLLIALASILYGSAIAFTQTDARLIAGYSSVAQLGFITLGIFSLQPQGAQGALLQMVNHGLVVAPLFFIIALLAKRAGGSEDIRDMGGIAFRAPRARDDVPDRRARDARDAGVRQLRGRVPDPARRLQDEDRDLDHRLRRRRDGARLRAAPSSARCTTASGRRSTRASSRSATARVLVPFVAAILFLAFYPQLALHRSEGAVNTSLASARTALREPSRRTEAAAARRTHGTRRRRSS